MLHCLIKLSDKTKHSLVCPAVSVQVPTATTRSSQIGWRPSERRGRQPIRTVSTLAIVVMLVVVVVVVAAAAAATELSQQLLMS